MRLLITAGWLAALLVWESKTNLRRVVDNKLTRDTRNLFIAGGAAAATQFLELPVALALAKRAERRQIGLLPATRAPGEVQLVAAVLLLDYTLYFWHRLTHRVSLLWRFHQVHHLDREMDASTALRFHFGEITLSVAFRALQIRLIGPTPAAYSAWQTFLVLCILFHHANIRLPLVWERRIAHLVVTPRLHGIHHSISADEVNSNWSSGLTIWDWLHGTLRTTVSQDSITVGVPHHLDDASQHWIQALTLPVNYPAEIPPAPLYRSREPLALLEP